MRARYAETGHFHIPHLHLPFAPVFNKFKAAETTESAAARSADVAKAFNPATLVEFFGLGWLCGFAAGAGLVAIFLR